MSSVISKTDSSVATQIQENIPAYTEENTEKQLENLESCNILFF